MKETSSFLDIPLSRKPLETLTEDCLAAIDRVKAPVIFACANPHSLVVAQSDPEFRAALAHAEPVVIDGIGVSIIGKLLGLAIGPRITGADYFFSLMNALESRGSGRVFFFGSSPRVLGLITERFKEEFPSLTLCGTYSPPFGSWTAESNAAIVRAINAARPDVLWVGMTAPKQEKWAEANRCRLNTPVIGSIGAVFDFYAGTYSRAPRWLCRIGLEWAYRLCLEPRRMWRRNIVSAPIFAWLVVKRHVLGRAKAA